MLANLPQVIYGSLSFVTPDPELSCFYTGMQIDQTPPSLLGGTCYINTGDILIIFQENYNKIVHQFSFEEALTHLGEQSGLMIEGLGFSQKNAKQYSLPTTTQTDNGKPSSDPASETNLSWLCGSV